jgi:hypothetical protein
MDSNSLWEKRIKAISESGFDLVRESRSEEMVSTTPDAVFMGSDDTELNGAILCLYKDDAASTFMYMAIEQEFTQTQIDELSKKDGFFYDSEPGVYSGHVPMRLTEYPVGSDVPYDDLKAEFTDEVEYVMNLGVCSAPFKMNGEALRNIPFFSDEQEPTLLSDEEIFEALKDNLGDGIYKIEMTEEQKERFTPDVLDPVEQGLSDKYKPKPGRTPRIA